MTENDTRIAEVEYLLSNYFYSHFEGVMNSVKKDLEHNQAKEMADYSLSFGDIATMLSASANPLASMNNNSHTHLKKTGEYNSKTTEDYVEMCKAAIAGNKDFQEDLTRLAGEWRNAVIAKIGRQRYDNVSQKLGADVALAYVDSRIEQMMVDKMVRDKMPKSSFEYITRKGAASSFLGLSQLALQSPLEAEIEARGEAAYKPSAKEKIGAKALGFGADLASLGGASSWASLVRLAGWEVVFSGVESYMDNSTQKPQTITVDSIISKALLTAIKM